VLGRSLDELPPQTRRLLELIHEMVTAECERRQIDQADFRFSRREVREHTGWGNTQLKIHFHRLEEMEYLVVHRGGPGQRFAYELLWTGQGRNGESFLLGLIDPIKLERYDYDGDRSGSGANRSGSKLDRSPPGRPPVGGVSGGGRGEETAAKGKSLKDFPSLAADSAENALLGGKKSALSYGDVRRRRRALPLAAAGGAADEEKRL